MQRPERDLPPAYVSELSRPERGCGGRGSLLRGHPPGRAGSPRRGPRRTQAGSGEAGEAARRPAEALRVRGAPGREALQVGGPGEPAGSRGAGEGLGGGLEVARGGQGSVRALREDAASGGIGARPEDPTRGPRQAAAGAVGEWSLHPVPEEGAASEPRSPRRALAARAGHRGGEGRLGQRRLLRSAREPSGVAPHDPTRQPRRAGHKDPGTRRRRPPGHGYRPAPHEGELPLGAATLRHAAPGGEDPYEARSAIPYRKPEISREDRRVLERARSRATTRHERNLAARKDSGRGDTRASPPDHRAVADSGRTGATRPDRNAGRGAPLDAPPSSATSPGGRPSFQTSRSRCTTG